ncbi:MAG: STAS domain-containing protein [Gallionella sp.]|nr:STAS domain-containing protein [Gallionella sp.]
MAINVRIYDRSARVAMSGRFDFQVHRDFKDAYAPLLDNAAVHEIEIEMSQLDYVDSSALGMLMLLNERANAANKTVSLLNTAGAVSKLLEVANFNQIFNIKHTSVFIPDSRNNAYIPAKRSSAFSCQQPRTTT